MFSSQLEKYFLDNEIVQYCVYGLFFTFFGLFAIICVLDCIWEAQEEKAQKVNQSEAQNTEEKE